MFQTRGKYSKHAGNVSTALYSQRVAIPDKNNMRQVSATVSLKLRRLENCDLCHISA